MQSKSIIYNWENWALENSKHLSIESGWLVAEQGESSDIKIAASRVYFCSQTLEITVGIFFLLILGGAFFSNC